jgi:hypothetical protein
MVQAKKTGATKRTTVARKKSSGPQKKKSASFAAEVAAEVQVVLLELMKDSESDSVRVAAAKALMDRVKADEEEIDDVGRREAEERVAAIAEARALLDELAVAKSCSLCEPSAMVERGASGADNAGG